MLICVPQWSVRTPPGHGIEKSIGVCVDPAGTFLGCEKTPRSNFGLKVHLDVNRTLPAKISSENGHSPLKSHDFVVRLTVLSKISRSHDSPPKSHGFMRSPKTSKC